MPDRLVGDGLFDFARRARGEQESVWLEPTPVSTQGLEQRRAKRKVAVLASLAVDNSNDHALTIDVAELQTGYFGAAHAGAIKHHQNRAVKQRPAGVDQPLNFFLAEDAGKLPAHARIRNEVTELEALQRANVKKAQSGHVVHYRARGQLA